MEHLPPEIEKKLELIALENALGNILSELPANWEVFTDWLYGVVDIPRDDLEELEDMVIWEPFEFYDDEALRELIINEASVRFTQIREVFMLGVQELLPTLELISRCSQARLAGCDAYMIKQDVMDKAKELVEQYKEEESGSTN